MTGYLVNAFIYLCAAVIAVPLAKRFGLGSVLGYLIAGVVIGPVLGLVGQETATLQHFAEFGVVMMLFLVGLELEPAMLWNMRHRLVGLGGLQVAATTAPIVAIGLHLGYSWQVSLTIGWIFSLSSTAIVLQTFSEKGLAKTPGGRTAFSVLLFQDIAVIPMLALIPLLALPELTAQEGAAAVQGDSGHPEMSLVAGLDGWATALVVAGAVGAVVLGGRFLGRPLFQLAASTGLREVFTATSLALVIGIAALMSLVGLSPALGTFLAGVVLANSEFRHELETTIEPFKGLLLGLFFITVGAGIQFSLLQSNLAVILALTLGIMALKALVLLGLALLFRVRGADGWLFTLSLAQAGEFGFVLLGYSVQNQVLPGDLAPMLSMVVALSMFLTPILFIAFDKIIVPMYQRSSNEREADEVDEQGPVIIAGIGRFGQIVNRLLTANGIKTVILDREVGQVDNLRKIHVKSFYGDATRHDLLHQAGIDEASLFVVAIDEQEQVSKLVRELRHSHPYLKILARAYDRVHSYHLRDAGADYIVNETYHSALALGTEVLINLGVHPVKAEQSRTTFLQTETVALDALYKAWGQRPEGGRVGTHYLEAFIELDAAMKAVMQSNPDCSANGADLFIEDSGKRRDPALVFLHGFSFDSRMWRAQLDYFDNDYRVLAYDARGFGRSPQPPDKPWSAPGDLDAVLAQASINRAILVAHSMAAITACDYCHQHPERVEAMILVSPSAANYHWPEGFMAQWVAYQELAAVNMEAAKAAWLGSELFTRAGADSEVAAQMQAMIDSYSGWHWLTNQSISTSQLAASELPRIEQPVLLVNGSDDSPAFLDCAGMLAQQFPNSRRLLIRDSDHMCNMEQPGVFNRAVDDFIAKLAAVPLAHQTKTT